MPRTALTADATLQARRPWQPSAPTIAAGAALAARTAVGCTRKPRRRRLPKLAVAFDLGGRAAVEPFENPLTVFRPKLVEQLVAADDPRFCPAPVLSQQRSHRLRELAVVGDADGNPGFRPEQPASLPPASHEHDEIVPSENRPGIVSRRADAFQRDRAPAFGPWKTSAMKRGSTRELFRRLRRVAGGSAASVASPDGLQGPVVSLTFDDGVASQRLAAELLAERGLSGTFYVTSGSIGREGHLGWDDLAALVAQGHEIGGHTSGHAHLPALTVEEARREIESDRLALLERGLNPVTFAYPFGESSPAVESIVREVGYSAARGVGGVVESLPPENPYRLRSPHSARAWTTAEQLAALVLVGAHEAGWMIVPFHHLEAEGQVASTYTTDPEQFREFLDWLVERAVRVACVRDVVGRGVPG